MTDFVGDVCKALSHPARRALLQALLRGECDVGRLSTCLELDQPTASKNLAILRSAGLVHVRVDGQRRCYSVNHPEIVRSLLDLLAELEEESGQTSGGAASGLREDARTPRS